MDGAESSMSVLSDGLSLASRTLSEHVPGQRCAAF